jgi:kinesin family protein 5
MQNTENIKVALRIKPVKDSLNIKVDDNIITLNENGKDSQYIFDHIFSTNTTQQDIFSTIGKPSVDWVCEGYNATIFAYGSTGSGKTFTMFGHEDGKSNIGIIPRACEALFQNIEKNEDVIEATMKCSFLEIYREHIRDLLKKDISGELKIRQSQIKGIFVQGLTEKYVYSSADILNTIKEGSSRRTVASTSLNTVSSRSHSLLTLTLTQILSDGTEITSKLNLVDLAGSENVGKSEVQGISLAEAQNINKSLSSLGNVIYALTEKNREHIPYRDSKLTFLLQDSLGGKYKHLKICKKNKRN